MIGEIWRQNLNAPQFKEYRNLKRGEAHPVYGIKWKDAS